MIKSKIAETFLYFFLLLLTLLCFSPFYLMIINATQSNYTLMTTVSFFPGKSFLENYRNMSGVINVWSGFRNSFVIAVLSTALSAYFGALTAFGLSKYEFRGRNMIFWIVLVSMMIPGQLGIIGLFRLSRYLKILDTYIPLIIPSIANASTIFFVRQYISSTVPDSLLEAARVEGARELQIFHKIILILVKPAIATMSIFNFVSVWNNFMNPMILLLSQKKFTLPLLIMNLTGGYNRDLGATYCGIAISIVPIMIVYIFMSKHITEGVTAGAVKG